MLRQVWSPAIAFACILIGCRPPAIDLEAEGRALMQVSREWSNRVATGNVDSIMAGWAHDAVMMVPGLPALEGQPAIRSYVEAGMRLPGFSIKWEPISVHVARSGDFAYMIERNESTVNDSTGKPITSYGKVVTVWRKDATGMWKNVIDMWNDAPPPRP